ncbi:hypothetical protein CLOP_g10636 [Closterium sp. NIES-67]|nr:hypothetical protein CLOP_g10636 [Closterium sp. NIES-67]
MDAASLSAPSRLLRHSLVDAPLPRAPLSRDVISRRAHRLPPLRARASGGGGGGGGFPKGQGLVGLNGQPLSSSSNSGGGGGGLYLPFLKPAERAPEEAGGSVEELLEAVRERRGLWYEYAPAIAALGRQGLSPAAIAEATGMTGVEQSAVTTAAQVRATLTGAGMDAALLAFFDVGGAEALYELRVLAGAQRKEAAEYVAREGLDGKGARDVARAIKEYERRKREADRSHFSAAPGDCLAFAFYRQSGEARSRAEREAALERAGQVAQTEGASAFLASALHRCRNPDAAPPAHAAAHATGAGAPAVAAAASLAVVRLRSSETQATPVPVVACAADLARLPALPQPQGPFRLFSPPPGLPWVALPSWPALRGVPSLVALLLPSPSLLPPLQARQGDGPVLVVVAGGWGEGSAVESKHYYVVRDAERGGERGLVVVAGGRWGSGMERGQAQQWWGRWWWRCCRPTWRWRRRISTWTTGSDAGEAVPGGRCTHKAGHGEGGHCAGPAGSRRGHSSRWRMVLAGMRVSPPHAWLRLVPSLCLANQGGHERWSAQGALTAQEPSWFL